MIVAAAASAIAAFSLSLTSEPASRPPAAHGSAPALAGQQHTAADAATGVRAAVGLQARSWGTSITLRITGVEGPERCTLMAIDTEGRAHSIGAWQVSAPTNGIHDDPDPLTLMASTDLTPSALKSFEVRTLSGQRLVDVPI